MRRSLLAMLVGISCALLSAQTALAQGLMAPGSGAMHRAMGGASTARAVDAAGALYWNPAAIASLPKSEVVIGSEMLLPDIHLGSTFLGRAGETRSDSGLSPLTGIGVVFQPEDSRLTYGLGIMTLAAGGVNYPGDPSNPVLSPTGPLGGFILGPQAASILILAIAPTTAYAVTDSLTVGFGPMLDVSVVSFDPALFGPTSQTGLLAPRQFPTGSHTRPFWGGGFRFGATFEVAEHLAAGASYTSPQWFETWEFNARDANGNPLTFETGFTLPQILSFGLAYDGIDRLLLTADLRWFDYRTTQLLGKPVVEGGANWDSIWAVALGSHYQWSERMSFQAGYIYNDNPVPALQSFFNTQLPLINQHTLSLGSHFQLNEWLGMSAAYVHGFENSQTGSLLPLLGSSTTLKAEYDSFVFGLHIAFGPKDCASAAPAEAAPGLPQ